MILIDFITKECWCLMTYNKMRLIVGVFVIVITILMGVFMYFLLEEKGAFNKRYSFNFETDSASSFKIGMPLKYSGFDIGVIDNMELNDDGTVRMYFSVDEINRRWITQDSVLMIRKPLIGSSHIELYSAIDNDLLKNGGTLMLLLSDDINDMITKLQPAVDKIISIIINIDKLTLSISNVDSDLMTMLRNANSFTAKLSDDKSLLTSLTGSKNSTDDFISSLSSLEKMMANIEKITKHLDADIVNPSSSAIKELDLILKDVKDKLEKLEDLSLIKEQISTGIQKSNQIMDKVDSLMQSSDSQEVTLP